MIYYFKFINNSRFTLFWLKEKQLLVLDIISIYFSNMRQCFPLLMYRNTFFACMDSTGPYGITLHHFSLYSNLNKSKEFSYCFQTYACDEPENIEITSIWIYYSFNNMLLISRGLSCKQLPSSEIISQMKSWKKLKNRKIKKKLIAFTYPLQ